MIVRVVVAALGWCYQNVLGNLVASVLWGAPAFWVHHRRLKAHHTREIDALRQTLRGEE